jgi:hypothetical protein
VHSVHVSPGDQLTVSIWQISGSTWQIQIVNKHERAELQHSAPVLRACDFGRVDHRGSDELADRGLWALGGFTPNVTFTNDRYGGGGATTLARVAMIQSGRTVATPGPTNTAGNFTVAWGGVATPAP